MNLKWSISEKDKHLWNTFLANHKCGHYLQTSHWLASYKAYGFDYDICIIKNDDQIIAGIGIVYGGLYPFKIVVAPCGPIITKGFEEYTEPLIKAFLEKSKTLKAFYCHINLPLLANKNLLLSQYSIEDLPTNSVFYSGKKGIKIRQVSSINGFRSVNLEAKNHELIVKQFNTNTRRNIKAAQKLNLELQFALTEDAIKNAYHIIEQNGKTQGYAVREWNDIKSMLLNMVNDNLCRIPVCYYEGKIKGALILFDIGKRLTYISGGTLRESKDLKVGHFLHHEMIKYSIKKGYLFYDISVGGNPGVTRFKEGFSGEHFKFIEARHWILSPFKFSLYNKISNFVNKNKVLVSKILKLKRSFNKG